MTTAAAVTLSLAELEAHDPYARDGRERRFLCPLPGLCEEHQRGAMHRSLTLNVETGAWHCWRCTAAGKILERWEDHRPARQTSRDRARAAFSLVGKATQVSHGQHASHTVAAPSRSLQEDERPAPALRPESGPPVPSAPDWDALYQRLEPLGGSAGATYLAARGIPVDVAERAGVRWARSWYGRPAVVFPLTDADGDLVALQGRYVDGGTEPRMRDAGRKGAGVFATLGAFGRALPRVVLVEGPADALSLAAAGVPAVALCGKELQPWLPRFLAFRRVVIALDNDAPGDAAAVTAATKLRALGCSVERWRPGGKDWNQVLQDHGLEALRLAVVDDPTEAAPEVPSAPIASPPVPQPAPVAEISAAVADFGPNARGPETEGRRAGLQLPSVTITSGYGPPVLVLTDAYCVPCSRPWTDAELEVGHCLRHQPAELAA